MSIRSQFFEYLDLARNPGPEYRERLVDFDCACAMNTAKIDLVITLYPKPCYSQLRRQDHFPLAPIVALYLPLGFEQPQTDRRIIRQFVTPEMTGTLPERRPRARAGVLEEPVLGPVTVAAAPPTRGDDGRRFAAASCPLAPERWPRSWPRAGSGDHRRRGGAPARLGDRRTGGSRKRHRPSDPVRRTPAQRLWLETCWTAGTGRWFALHQQNTGVPPERLLDAVVVDKRRGRRRGLAAVCRWRARPEALRSDSPTRPRPGPSAGATPATSTGAGGACGGGSPGAPS